MEWSYDGLSNDVTSDDLVPTMPTMHRTGKLTDYLQLEAREWRCGSRSKWAETLGKHFLIQDMYLVRWPRWRLNSRWRHVLKWRTQMWIAEFSRTARTLWPRKPSQLPWRSRSDVFDSIQIGRFPSGISICAIFKFSDILRQQLPWLSRDVAGVGHGWYPAWPRSVPSRLDSHSGPHRIRMWVATIEIGLARTVNYLKLQWSFYDLFLLCWSMQLWTYDIPFVRSVADCITLSMVW
jgi:hypothetical protein